MKNNKVPVIIEYAWIGMAVFCLVLGIIKTGELGIKLSAMFYLLSFISLAMFFMRRMNRKNIERRNKRMEK
ncbi:MAG TPA: hypothetical protein PLZ52_05995 [Bacteroidales bacterium]|nr:hypothetical protein [Bacteroidales bacterium]HOE04749.1 hypothetical protein [Bacteroidales bacterium]